MSAEGVWPRLQSSQEKPHWISLDFSHWEYQKEGSEEEDSQEEREGGERRKGEVDPKMMKKMVWWRRGGTEGAQ